MATLTKDINTIYDQLQSSLELREDSDVSYMTTVETPEGPRRMKVMKRPINDEATLASGQLNVAAQGDVNISNISEEQFNQLLDLNMIEKTTFAEMNYQAVQGTSKGSRHCFDPASVKNATIYKFRRGSNPLWSCVVVNPEPTVLTHPEHDHYQFFPGTHIYTRQRAAAEELRALED